jgi:hypothetical protein
MPQFNASSALLLKRFIESGVTSPEELANVMGNASVETGGFSTMDEQLKGYHSVEQVVGAVKSAGTRNTREEIQAAVDSQDPKQPVAMSTRRTFTTQKPRSLRRENHLLRGACAAGQGQYVPDRKHECAWWKP